jgi:uncharacterized membrane protein
MNDLNEDKLYQKIIKPLKKQNITAPDDLWLKVRGKIENPANPFLNLRLQLATFSFLVIVGIGLFQANQVLNENVLQSQDSVFADYEYFMGTF